LITGSKNYRLLIPVFGTFIFIILYVTATCFYPGGSQVDKNAVGFSWANNYWCNLLNEIAINGKPNPARPFALAGMLVLCFTLAYFWYIFPTFVPLTRNTKYIIQFAGIGSMTIAFFLFTSLHDTISNIAGFLGVIALTGTFVGLWKIKWFVLFGFGMFNLLLVVLNNYVYHTEGLLAYLPVIQKISFAAFLTWICCIAICLFKKQTT
jgi:hypothetical protein